MQPSSGLMFKFFYRIILPSLLAMLLFVMTLFFIVIPVFEQAMMDRKREMIKELTNSASSILDKYYKDETEGILTRDEAQQTAISRIQYLRYGEENKDYFWITDMQPRMIMHPYVPELNGTDLTDYEDSHGKKMFVEFVDAVKDDGQGFVEYMWQWKDDSTHVVSKLSYVKKFEPWGWIIGTGIYIEDVRREISALSSRLLQISLIIVAIVALLLTFISLQSLKIEKRRQLAETNLKQSREKYRSLVDASTEGLIMISDNEIIFANSIFLNLAGLDSNEISQMKWQNIFTLPDELKQKLEQGEDDVETAPFETDIFLPGNRKAEVLVNISPIIFYGNKAVIFSIKDISSDNQIKKELHESRERFKTLMDKLNVGIFRTTMDARGRFVEANQTAIRLMGYENNEQLKDKYILDYFADSEDRKNFRKKLLESGFIKNQVVKLRNTDGSIKNMLVSLAVITDESGQAAFCDGTIEPMTSKSLNNNDTYKLIDITDFRAIISSISVNTFAKKIHKIKTTQSVSEAMALMQELNEPVFFVCDNDNNILGYVSNAEIVLGLSDDNADFQSPVFQFMRSPIISVHENTSVLKAKSIFSKKQTAVITIKDSSNNLTGYIQAPDLNTIDELRMSELFEYIDSASSIETLTLLRKEFIDLISKLAINRIPSNIILQLLSEVFDTITSRLFQISLNEFGAPPVDFAFIVMGSEGRQEQTLKTDQDNAIIYADNAENKEVAADYFLKLGTWICESLNAIGYDLCKGDNMAMNPKWNKPLSIWKDYFHTWINNGQPQDLLDINIFFDFRLSFGSHKITDELEDHIIHSSKTNPAFLHHMAKNAMLYKPSVNMFGNIVVESSGAPADTIRIKDNISAIVSFVRIYALKNAITQKQTVFRIEQLLTQGVISDSERKNLLRIFDYLTSLRIQHQASLILENNKPDNYINVKLLSDIDQTTFKKSLSVINDVLSRLTIDFNLN